MKDACKYSLADFQGLMSKFPELKNSTQKDSEELFMQFLKMEKSCMAEPMDFLKYQFYKMSPEQIREYVTRRQYEVLCNLYNDAHTARILKDKVLFMEHYGSFAEREFCLLSPKNWQEYLDLMERHRILLLKPRNGAYGRGIKIITPEDRRRAWEAAITQQYIAEEIIEQNKSFSTIHPESVNTVRILTVISSAKQAVVVAAAFRCGIGRSITDNGDGVFAAVDVNSGIVCTYGMTHFHEVYRQHPQSGIDFKGYKIPFWEKLVKRAKDAALLYPRLRLVNWDWTLDSEGKWVLIEGNTEGGIGPCQESLHKGLKREIMRNF